MELAMLWWSKREPEKHLRKIPVVGFDPNHITEAVKRDLRQNVKSLTEVNSRDFESVFDAALRSIAAGRALHILYEALIAINGIGERRAREIAQSLNNKASALMQSESQARLGIKFAHWIYSGASCGDAAQDALHKSANRMPYRVEKGLLLNGIWTLPGRDDQCKCISKPMIVGLDGYDGGVPKGLKK